MDDDRSRSADADEPRRSGDRDDGSSPADGREDDPTPPTDDREEDQASPTDDREEDPTPSTDDGTAASASGGREVVVPMRLYKTVTVFSTLLAIVFILGGFVLLDRGTQRATASPEDVSLPVVALGLALIVGGSAVYAFSTRFRTEGMGKPKDDTDEDTNNG